MKTLNEWLEDTIDYNKLISVIRVQNEALEYVSKYSDTIECSCAYMEYCSCYRDGLNHAENFADKTISKTQEIINGEGDDQTR